MFSNMTVLILINYTLCLTHSSHYCFKCRFVSFSFYKALFIIIIFYYLIINVEIFNQYCVKLFGPLISQFETLLFADLANIFADLLLDQLFM